ncbi:MAG: hypothetical protein ACLFTR_00660 [Candidatus Woesearchaeota archaeon]
MFKKGSLNLSINAIVVLILAVTMLGLGLMFMQNMMGGAMGELDEVSGTVEEQMIEQIRESEERLSFKTTNIDVDRASDTDNYYGVMNQLEEQGAFDIFFGCDQAMSGDGKVSHITFEYIPVTTPIGTNSVDVQRVRVNADPQASTTSYRCAVFVEPQEEGDGDVAEARENYESADDDGKTEIVTELTTNPDVYEYKYFYVNVE